MSDRIEARGLFDQTNLNKCLTFDQSNGLVTVSLPSRLSVTSIYHKGAHKLKGKHEQRRK